MRRISDAWYAGVDERRAVLLGDALDDEPRGLLHTPSSNTEVVLAHQTLSLCSTSVSTLS